MEGFLTSVRLWDARRLGSFFSNALHLATVSESQRSMWRREGRTTLHGCPWETLGLPRQSCSLSPICCPPPQKKKKPGAGERWRMLCFMKHACQSVRALKGEQARASTHIYTNAPPTCTHTQNLPTSPFGVYPHTPNLGTHSTGTVPACGWFAWDPVNPGPTSGGWDRGWKTQTSEDVMRAGN